MDGGPGSRHRIPVADARPGGAADCGPAGSEPPKHPGSSGFSARLAGVDFGMVEVRGEPSNRNSAPGWSAGGAILKMVGLLGEDSNRIFETLLEWEEHLKPFRDELKAVGLMDAPRGPGL